MQNNRPSMQIGIASLCWQNKTGDAGLNSTMDTISKANFDGCELSQRFPQDPFLVKNSLKQSGVKISSAQFHTYFTDKNRFNDTINRFLDHMHFLNAIGAKRIVVFECANNTFENVDQFMLENQPEASSAQFKLLVEGLNKIGRLAHDAGMQVVYQPRIGTVIHSEKEIDKLMAKTDPETVFLSIDTGHFEVLGITPLSILKKYSSRVNYIYLKDVDKRVLTKVKKNRLSYPAAREAALFTILGRGSLDFSRFLEELKAIQYRGWVIAYGTDSDNEEFSDSAKKTRKFMKVTLGI